VVISIWIGEAAALAAALLFLSPYAFALGKHAVNAELLCHGQPRAKRPPKPRVGNLRRHAQFVDLHLEGASTSF
jgi:hypothetical protein